MNILMQNFDIKKIVLCFCFLAAAFFSNISYGEYSFNQDSSRRKTKAAPMVINTIPNQTAQQGVPFNLDIHALAA